MAETTETANETNETEAPETEVVEKSADDTPETNETDETETKEDDWRASIADEGLRKQVGKYASVSELAKAFSSARGMLNKALVVPGKDASPEDVQAFRVKLGAPKDADGYDFLKPANGEEINDTDMAGRKAWAERFHGWGVPNDVASDLINAYREDMVKADEELIKEDDNFASSTEKALRQEWGPDYDENHRLAVAAAKERFGEDYESMREIRGLGGRLLMDHPAMVRLLAQTGRDMMGLGMIGPSEDERDGIENEIGDLRKKIAEAQGAGNSKLANKLYQKEQSLLARIDKSPIVGANARVA